VVVDEAVGMLVALLFLPAAWEVAVAAFFLFRVLDITKPWPAYRLERIPAGAGILADDLVVGLYTNLLLQLAAAWVLP
jgi:phosphatidylglycerophosphatase A